MARIIKDEELRAYQERIGAKQYRALYMYELNKAIRLRKSNKRYSGENYVNPEEKLNAIKEKYKNGVTDDILAEFMENM
jgi:adenine specific DNA methylase Mod